MQVSNPEDISSNNEEGKNKKGKIYIFLFLVIISIIFGAFYYNFKNNKDWGVNIPKVQPIVKETVKTEQKDTTITQEIDNTVYKDKICNDLPSNRRKELSFENNKDAKVLTFIACSDKDKQDGLIGVFQLADNHGMLFVFEKPDGYKFWMRDTSLYLSVAFLNEDREIMEIIDPEPLSEERFGPDNKTKYVLEVNKGWFNENNIKVGDKLSLE